MIRTGGVKPMGRNPGSRFVIAHDEDDAAEAWSAATTACFVLFVPLCQNSCPHSSILTPPSSLLSPHSSLFLSAPCCALRGHFPLGVRDSVHRCCALRGHFPLGVRNSVHRCSSVVDPRSKSSVVHHYKERARPGRALNLLRANGYRSSTSFWVTEPVGPVSSSR